MPEGGLHGQSSRAASVGAGAFRIDVDLEEAERAAERVREWLTSLRHRHDLTRFEYTQHVRIVPASATFSHPILTLGTRFAESEDHLLATYLHEQMHWYLWRLGGLDFDPVAPFFDELVRRYPKAPTRLPEGARNYEQTYVHIVVCWLELKAVSEFIGWDRAARLAETNYGYRWIYRTVIRDFEELEALFMAHGILPMQPAEAFLKARVANGAAGPTVVAAKTAGKTQRKARTSRLAKKKPAKKRPTKAATKATVKKTGVKKTGMKKAAKKAVKRAAPRKTPSKARTPRSRPAPRKRQARGGRRRG